MKKTLFYFFSVFILAGLVLSTGPVAIAQDDQDTFMLEEITVTAEKREENVQKTAISIAAITGNVIRDEAKISLDSLLKEVPAVHIQKSPQGGQPYIRGVGSNGDSNAVDPSVAVMFDGVYSGRAEALEMSMYDLARVEVLRGPQGTLYGRNATGGTVNVVSQAPLLGETEFVVNAQAGNYSLYHFDGAINVPVGDSLAFRVAALREKRDGYFSNGGRESDLTGVRLRALYEPSEKFSLLLTGEYSNQQGLDNTTVAVAHDVPPPFVPFPFRYQPNPDDPWEVDEDHPADIKDITFETVSLQMEYDFSWTTLTLLPAYTHSDRWVRSDLITGTLFSDALPEGGAILEDQYTFEARLSSPAESKLIWQTGIYYLYSKNGGENADGDQVIEETNYISYSTGTTPTKSMALFGQATYPLTDEFRLTFGGRYTKDDKEENYGYRSYDDAYLLYDTGLEDSSSDYSSFTWKAGAEYDLADENMLYFTISTGYKAGGFVKPAAPPITYDPEYLTAFEIGSKNRFLDNRLQVNAEIYYYNYEDYQVTGNYQAPLPVPTESLACYDPLNPYNQDDENSSCYGQLTMFSAFTANADTGTNYGGEIETQFLLTAVDEITVKAAYTKAEYGDVDISIMTNLPPGALSAPFLSGQEVSNTPEWSANLGYSHSFDLPNGGRITAKAQAMFSAGYWTTIEQWWEGAWQDDYHKTDAFLTYYAPNDTWNINVWVKNIEDEAQTQFTFPLWRKMISDPRTFGVNFAARW